MSFNLSTFEAEVVLRLIPANRLPAAAQNALDAGHNGPHLRHMAIADPQSSLLLDQHLPPMLTELGCRPISPAEAALRLARQRAQAILASHEDPLPALPHFRQLMLVGGEPEELLDLGYLGDDYAVAPEDQEQLRAFATELLTDLVSPQSREERRAERQASWLRQQETAKNDWPVVFQSATGLALLKARFIHRLASTRATFALATIGWLLFGAAYMVWRVALLGCVTTFFVLGLLALWGQYRLLESERRETLLHLAASEEFISSEEGRRIAS